MNIHHLKYFIALGKRNSYREAANFCNVSQPAISMAIKTMEEKLGGLLISRHKTPIELTPFGQTIFRHALNIVNEYEQMMSYKDSDGILGGEINLGIIPTVASSLIPQFITPLLADFPKLKLSIHEITTAGIIDMIYKDELDAGIVATPIEHLKLHNHVLYYEEFMAYSSDQMNKDYILPSDIEIKNLWLLEEGHCLRSQILNLCELKASTDGPISYNAGSIDTLLNLVDGHGGITIVPELTVSQMDKARKKRVSLFTPPAPVREISLISHKYSHKKKQIEAIISTINRVIPSYMKDKEDHINPPISLS